MTVVERWMYDCDVVISGGGELWGRRQLGRWNAKWSLCQLHSCLKTHTKVNRLNSWVVYIEKRLLSPLLFTLWVCCHVPIPSVRLSLQRCCQTCVRMMRTRLPVCTHPVCLPVCAHPVCLPVYPSRLSVCLYPSHLSACLCPSRLSACLHPVCPPVCTHPVCLPVCTHPVCPSVCTHPVCLPVCAHPVCLPVCAHPVCLPVCTHPVCLGRATHCTGLGRPIVYDDTQHGAGTAYRVGRHAVRGWDGLSCRTTRSTGLERPIV